MILAGMLCYRLRLLPKEVNKSLSNLVLLVASPAVILVSYQKPFDAALLAGLGWSFLLAAICFAAAVLLPVLLLRGGRSSRTGSKTAAAKQIAASRKDQPRPASSAASNGFW